MKVTGQRRVVVGLDDFECETDFWCVKSMLGPLAGIRDLLVEKNLISFQAPSGFDENVFIRSLMELGFKQSSGRTYHRDVPIWGETREE